MFDKIKRAAKYVKDKIVGAFVARVENDLPPPVNTDRYVHVSVMLHPIEDAMLRELAGLNYIADPVVTTYNTGANILKRAADMLGQNNKQRRRLRSKMKRRAAELRAGAA
jgi:hypothetical protein